MKYISLFSGIGGFDLAFKRAGMECVAVCEIDANAQGILKRHFPEAQLFDDVKKIGDATHERGSIDLICGGFPCQDVSVAGKRAGLAGERSGLWFEFARIIDELEPRWVVIENVPGLLSSNRGEDFAVIIQWLVQRGYGVSWRILDAQFFGVPQRRRRVFIVGSLGNGRSAEVLFEREGMSGDPPPRGEEGKDVAYSLRSNPSHSGDKGDGGINTTLIGFNHKASSARNMPIVEDGTPSLETNHQGMAVAIPSSDLAAPLTASGRGTERAGESRGQDTLIVEQNNKVSTPDMISLRSNPAQPVIAFGGNNTSGPINKSTALNAHGGTGRHDFESETFIAYGIIGETTPKVSEDVMPTLRSAGENTGENHQFVGGSFGVRRLTPVECERLQGFPDDWTDGQSDSARYRQLGNAVAVPVVEWIGKRIMANDQSLHLP